MERRVRWAKAVVDTLAVDSTQDNVRAMDFIIDNTTDIAIHRLAPKVLPNEQFNTRKTYPARYRLPQANHGYSRAEMIIKIEIFALGSLFYELASGQSPWAEVTHLTEDEIALRFTNHRFPDSTPFAELGTVIEHCWTREYTDVGQVASDVNGICELDSGTL